MNLGEARDSWVAEALKEKCPLRLALYVDDVYKECMTIPYERLLLKEDNKSKLQYSKIRGAPNYFLLGYNWNADDPNQLSLPL